MAIFTPTEEEDLALLRNRRLELINVLGGDNKDDVPTNPRDVAVYIQAMGSLEGGIHKEAAMRQRQEEGEAGEINASILTGIFRGIAKGALDDQDRHSAHPPSRSLTLPDSMDKKHTPEQLAIGVEYLDPDEIENLVVDEDDENTDEED